MVVVYVRFFGFFIDIVGKKQLNIRFKGTTTLGDLISLIGEKTHGGFYKNVMDPKTNRLRSHVIVTLNKTKNLRELNSIVKEGDELAFYPVSAGG